MKTFVSKSLAVAAFALTLGAVTQASASIVQLSVSQDVAVYAGGNNATNPTYDWVGHSGNTVYSSIFGFDLSSLAGDQINSITFSAYHNYSSGDSLVGAAVGLTNGWNRNTVNGSYALGSVLSTQLETSHNVNSYQTWTLGSPSFTGNYLTVGLVDVGIGWNDFSTKTAGNAAFITVDYGPQSIASVPEPESLALVGLGLAGLSFTRRKAKKA